MNTCIVLNKDGSLFKVYSLKLQAKSYIITNLPKKKHYHKININKKHTFAEIPQDIARIKHKTDLFCPQEFASYESHNKHDADTTN